jgi:hypothetical protein
LCGDFLFGGQPVGEIKERMRRCQVGLGLNDAVREQSGSIRQRLKVKKRWQPEGVGGEGACTEKEWVKNESRTGQELVKNGSGAGGRWYACLLLPVAAWNARKAQEQALVAQRSRRKEASSLLEGSQESQEKPAYLAFNGGMPEAARER